MMTQITDKVWAVEVPDDVKDLGCEKSMTGTPYLFYKLKDDELLNEYEDIKLSPGTWRFLFATKTATEEDAHKIVESVTTVNELPVYRDYEFTMWMKSAVASLHSLLRSKNLDDNKNYALIEKQNTDE